MFTSWEREYAELIRQARSDAIIAVRRGARAREKDDRFSLATPIEVMEINIVDVDGTADVRGCVHIDVFL